MHWNKIPGIGFRKNSFVFLKSIITLILMAGCGPNPSEPPLNEKSKEIETNEKVQTISVKDTNKRKKKDQEEQTFVKKKQVEEEQQKIQNTQETQAKPEKILIDAPHIIQKPELDRGCEVTSLAMLLQHAGVSVDKMTLANKIKKVPFKKNGLRGNLNDGFVGNMETFSQPGIGVFHGPIKDLAETYLPGKVLDLTGKGFNEAVIAQLDQNRPVWVIVTSTFDVVPEQHWTTWQTSSGPLRITYKMHSVLVTGYDQEHIYINDPLNKKNRQLARQPFINSWEQFGKQAITIEK